MLGARMAAGDGGLRDAYEANPLVAHRGFLETTQGKISDAQQGIYSQLLGCIKRKLVVALCVLAPMLTCFGLLIHQNFSQSPLKRAPTPAGAPRAQITQRAYSTDRGDSMTSQAAPTSPGFTAADGLVRYPTYAPRLGSPRGRARILCWIMTSPSTLPTKGAAVNSTWLRRCDVRLFMSSAEHADPAVIKIMSQEGRQHLTAKTMRAFKYVYDRHFNDCEWFLKADDDTYVVMDNLRRMLADYKPEEALFFGHRFKMHIQPNGYNSGGAGYVLSKQALFRYGEFGFGHPSQCNAEGNDEDVEMGRCMQNLGVKVVDTRDNEGRNRFHAYSAAMHLGGGLPHDYASYDWNGVASGLNATSPYAISFHYVKPEEMAVLEYFTTRFKVSVNKDPT